MKTCRTCREPKPPEAFYRNPSTSRPSGDGYRPDCRDCHTAKRRTTYATTAGAEAHRQNLRTAYGLTPDQYAARLTEQGNACALCRGPETVTYKGRPRRLAVDHNHRTGAVRALLCQRCNFLVGMIETDPALVATAAAYLTRRVV